VTIDFYGGAHKKVLIVHKHRMRLYYSRSLFIYYYYYHYLQAIYLERLLLHLKKPYLKTILYMTGWESEGLRFEPRGSRQPLTLSQKSEPLMNKNFTRRILKDFKKRTHSKMARAKNVLHYKFWPNWKHLQEKKLKNLKNLLCRIHLKIYFN